MVKGVVRDDDASGTGNQGATRTVFTEVAMADLHVRNPVLRLETIAARGAVRQRLLQLDQPAGAVDAFYPAHVRISEREQRLTVNEAHRRIRFYGADARLLFVCVYNLDLSRSMNAANRTIDAMNIDWVVHHVLELTMAQADAATAAGEVAGVRESRNHTPRARRRRHRAMVKAQILRTLGNDAHGPGMMDRYVLQRDGPAFTDADPEAVPVVVREDQDVTRLGQGRGIGDIEPEDPLSYLVNVVCWHAVVILRQIGGLPARMIELKRVQVRVSVEMGAPETTLQIIGAVKPDAPVLEKVRVLLIHVQGNGRGGGFEYLSLAEGGAHRVDGKIPQLDRFALFDQEWTNPPVKDEARPAAVDLHPAQPDQRESDPLESFVVIRDKTKALRRFVRMEVVLALREEQPLDLTLVQSLQSPAQCRDRIPGLRWIVMQKAFFARGGVRKVGVGKNRHGNLRGPGDSLKVCETRCLECDFRVDGIHKLLLMQDYTSLTSYNSP